MKAFIVEDSDIMRRHLLSMLAEIPKVHIVGHALDESGAIAQIEMLTPDIVILDLSLKQGSGIAVLEHVKKHHPSIKVMVLTNYTDEFYRGRCKNAGADYFFDKSFQFMHVGAALWQLLHTTTDHSPVN